MGGLPVTTAELVHALDAIEQQRPGEVHAGRKGVCVGINTPGKGTILFRRTDGTIRAEHWPYQPTWGLGITYAILPPALAERASRLMDR